MNVLWLCNVPLPEASLLLNEKPQAFGGWLDNLSKQLSKCADVSLSIAFPRKGINEIKILKGQYITYYVFPEVTSGVHDNIMQGLLCKVNPDVLHIWGTEYYHSFSAAKTFNCPQKVAINIQGLLSIYEKHYYAGLPEQVINSFTLRDFLKQDNLKQQRVKFKKGGKTEIAAIKNVAHIIGRTTWDKACSLQINPNAQYHFCNETLREAFYQHQWDLGKCRRHSIFISQGCYPIKGLHFMLEAMPEIIRQYPDTHLFIAGNNITSNATIKESLKSSSYGSYLTTLIRKYGLSGHITFTGIIDEKQMCAQYLKTHVFVSASSIENSPNSLGEAMLLGVPCVASCTGGVQDMLKDKDEGFLYPYDEPYMLAYYICELFANDDLALKFSKNARIHAGKTHNQEENNGQLLSIYRNILGIAK